MPLRLSEHSIPSQRLRLPRAYAREAYPCRRSAPDLDFGPVLIVRGMARRISRVPAPGESRERRVRAAIGFDAPKRRGLD
jgi:hypothetical protein